MEQTDIQRRITGQMERCADAIAAFIANAGDNTHCRMVEIQSVVRVMRANAELAVALAQVSRRQGGRG